MRCEPDELLRRPLFMLLSTLPAPFFLRICTQLSAKCQKTPSKPFVSGILLDKSFVFNGKQSKIIGWIVANKPLNLKRWMGVGGVTEM